MTTHRTIGLLLIELDLLFATSQLKAKHRRGPYFFSISISIDNPSIMTPANLPPIFSATSQDIEMLLAAQCHLGSKNLQVHMEPYLWKCRPDGVNIINIGKTW